MTDSGATLPDPVPEGYLAATAELERILAEIEADDVDVDVLADRVARAADLIRWCRSRIVAARAAIDDVAGDLV